MKEYFKELLEYSHFYNVELIKKYNDGDLHYVLPESSKRLMSHILNVQTNWNHRMVAAEEVDLWRLLEVDQLMQIEEGNHNKTMEILNQKDLEEILEFSNSKGESFKSSIKDIVFHLVNHATYHRGQIAKEFRKKGVDPVVSDFIHYKRMA